MEPRVFSPLPPTTARTRRFPGRTLLATILLMAGGTLLWAQVADNSGDSAGRQTQKRIREGTEIVDLDGHFRFTGDRMSFFSSDGKLRLVGLENLNLQRIARAVADDPRQLRWKVSGTVTEYRGANFLLVRQAILAVDPTLDREPQRPSGGAPIAAPPS